MDEIEIENLKINYSDKLGKWCVWGYFPPNFNYSHFDFDTKEKAIVEAKSFLNYQKNNDITL